MAMKQPLRNWSAPSYDPSNGRAAASSMEQRKSYSFDGERANVSAQMPNSGFNGRDARCTTIKTPVRNRPFQSNR